ncbi:hypothetical protein VCUG_01890, partial [Vavraia culicis subsp. floridensis]
VGIDCVIPSTSESNKTDQIEQDRWERCHVNDKIADVDDHIAHDAIFRSTDKKATSTNNDVYASSSGYCGIDGAFNQINHQFGSTFAKDKTSVPLSLSAGTFVVKNAKKCAFLYNGNTFITKFKKKRIHKIILNDDCLIIALRDALIMIKDEKYCNSVVIGNYVNDVVFFNGYLIVHTDEIKFEECCVESIKEDVYKKK